MFGNKLYANIFCSSIDYLKCTPSDRQMYPWGYMYPRLGTPGLNLRIKMDWVCKGAIDYFRKDNFLFTAYVYELIHYTTAGSMGGSES